MQMLDGKLICTGLSLEFWEQAKPFLQRAIDLNRGEFDLDDIYERVESRDMQLWGIGNPTLIACFVTEIIQYPRKKYVRGVILGGDGLDEWLPIMSQTMDRFAKHHGCNGVEILGRRGWLKPLKEHGYKDYETVISKEI